MFWQNSRGPQSWWLVIHRSFSLPVSLNFWSISNKPSQHYCWERWKKRDPTGLGRIVRDQAGEFTGIVEHKDASAEQLAIREVNMSTYLFQTSDLLQVLGQLSADNAQSEYYLTDCASLLREQGRPVAALPVLKECESLSINNVDELKQVDEKMRAMGYA